MCSIIPLLVSEKLNKNIIDNLINKRYRNGIRSYFKIKKKGLHMTDTNIFSPEVGQIQPDFQGDNLKAQDELMNQYIEKMMSEAGVRVNDRLREDLKMKMQEAILSEILMNLPDYLVDKISELFDAAEPDFNEVQKIIQESGIDVQSVTEKALDEFKENYLKNAKEEA